MEILSRKIVWPMLVICSVLLLFLQLCVAYPMDKIVVVDNSGGSMDMELAESSNSPVLVYPVANNEYTSNGLPLDTEVSESSYNPVVLQPENTNKNSVGGGKDTADTETAESSNIPVVVQPEAKSENHKAEDTNDAEAAASSNTQVVADAKYGVTDDFNLHSQAEDNASESKGFRISLLQPPVKTRESVNLEAEAVPSKVLSFYDNSQKSIVDKTQPLPILDTISEHEKYGNNGDMFDGISRSLVNGYEAFSNLLNTIIQKPKQIFRSINKSVNAQLDIIGGKLVGL